MTKITKSMLETGIKFTYAESFADKSLVGIHLLSPDEDKLWDAIDVADRDGCHQIILHSDKTWHKPRYSLLEKQSMRKGIREWIKTFESTGSGKYTVEKLANSLPIDEVIDSMSCRQLKTLLSLLSASYSTGCDTTRRHIGQLRENKAKEKVKS